MSSYQPGQTTAMILCCECGTAIEPNTANMCIHCLRARVDITEDLPRQLVIHHCRGCDRYLQPPTQWLPCALESKELLALILKRIKGLNKVRLVDAGFLWTEPHSKRLKVRLTVQREALSSTILQQALTVEVIVAGQQCPDCCRVEAKNTWNTVVQVRQKVPHKRTFLHLEQLILKHHAHAQVTRIRSTPDGLDFFFGSRSHAIKFVDFLRAVVPVRHLLSEQLITTDTHSGDSTYKFTISVEIVPVCKDDLVLLPPKVAKSLGGMCPLVLCMRVGTSLHLLDPLSLTKADLSAEQYWRDPFASLASTRQLIEYFVLEVEDQEGGHGGQSRGGGQRHERHEQNRLAHVVVAKASDFGRNSTIFQTRTHLGNVLKPGDMVLGYDLATANFNDPHWDDLRNRFDLADVILVRKSYAHLRRPGAKRTWRLQELPKGTEEGEQEVENGEAMAIDHELYLRELEEDPELRQTVNLYRNPQAMDIDHQAAAGEEQGEEVPKVSIEELLEDLTLE